MRVAGWTEPPLTGPLKAWEKLMDPAPSRTAVRRWGTPDEMGRAAVFLADPTLEFHTGDTAR